MTRYREIGEGLARQVLAGDLNPGDELPGIREYFAGFGERMPRELVEQLDALEARLA